MDDLRTEFLRDLEKRIADDSANAWWHLRWAAGCNVVAVLGSMGAALSASGSWFPPWGVALLAALPGAMLLVFQRFAFYSRSRWHCHVETHLQSLRRSLVFEGAELAEVSRQFSAFMEQAERQYPGDGLDGIGQASLSSKEQGKPPEISN